MGMMLLHVQPAIMMGMRTRQKAVFLVECDGALFVAFFGAHREAGAPELVSIAADSAEAMSCLGDELAVPSLPLVDLALPKSRVCFSRRELCQNEGLRVIPVAALTASNALGHTISGWPATSWSPATSTTSSRRYGTVWPAAHRYLLLLVRTFGQDVRVCARNAARELKRGQKEGWTGFIINTSGVRNAFFVVKRVPTPPAGVRAFASAQKGPPPEDPSF